MVFRRLGVSRSRIAGIPNRDGLLATAAGGSKQTVAGYGYGRKYWWGGRRGSGIDSDVLRRADTARLRESTREGVGEIASSCRSHAGRSQRRQRAGEQPQQQHLRSARESSPLNLPSEGADDYNREG